MDGEIMPEKMTKEEAVVAQTINHLRVVKELIQEEKRETVAYDDESEVVKVKRPKKTGEKDTTTIENNTGTHSGYGLAGQESHFKKQDEEDLKSDCREKISQIEEGMYSLNKAQLEELSNALSDIVQRIL